jgi:hypothetical protein
LPCRFESLHLPLSTPGRSRGIISPIVQVAALTVFDIRQDLALRHPITLQFVSYEDTRHILQALQQPFEKAFCRVGITPSLRKYVEHDAVLINGAPEILQLAQDPDEDLVQVPLSPGFGRRRRRLSAKPATNFRHQRRMLS